MTPKLFGFWTEHAVSKGCDSEPESSEVSGLYPGLKLLPCLDEPSVFVLRGVYGSYEDAKTAMDKIQDLGFEAWLTTWKTKHV